MQQSQGKEGQRGKVKEIVITSEMCSSTSLRRWRTLVMKWIAERQEGEEAGGSAFSG